MARVEEFQAEWKSLLAVQVAQNTHEATPSALLTAAPQIPLGKEEKRERSQFQVNVGASCASYASRLLTLSFDPHNHLAWF